MDQDIVRLLEARARVIAQEAARFLPARAGGVNDFQGIDLMNAPLTVSHPTAGHIVFRYNNYTQIDFTDIQPLAVTRQILHEPVLLSSNKLDAQATVIKNNSDAILEETYSYERSTTRTTNQDVGVSVEVGITQKIAYGGAASPVSGETGLSLAINTHYNKSWGESETESHTATRTVAVPPRTNLTLTAQTFEGAFSQRCEYWCDLGHGVRIQSHNDFDYNYSSLSQLHQAASGNAPSDVAGADQWRSNRSVHTWKIPRPIEVYYDTTVEFQNSTNGDVKVTSTSVETTPPPAATPAE